MADHGSGDFEALARQYWNRWGEILRAGADAAPAQGYPGAGFSAGGFPGAAGLPGASATMPGWNEAVAWWSQLAQGAAGPGAGWGGGLGNPADATLDRFNAQARGWYARMQQLAAQFAGQDASAADIAGAWKRALGGDFGNPFADVLRGMQGPGQQGFEQWFAQAAPFIEKLQRDGQAWSGMPAFGFTREHQERLQHLAQALADYQQQGQAYQSLMAEAAQDAFRRFEHKLGERSQPGRQLESARALFDLWIDAAEDAYAEVALSPRFRDAYGALVNSQMRLRAAVQVQVEQMGDALGMPTRTEVDAAHRKIAQLERELRRLQDRVAEGPSSRGSAAGRAPNPPGPETDAGRVPRRKPATKKPAAKPAAAKKASAAKAAKKPPGRASVTGSARKVR